MTPQGKQWVDTALASPLVSRIVGSATNGGATIFVLHRIAGRGSRHEGLDVAVLRGALEQFRRDGFRFVGLGELVAGVTDGRDLRRAIAFTADDGYDDQADELAPLLNSFECPLTIFLTSGFLDREFVPWWDRAGHAVWNSARPHIDVTVGGTALAMSLANDVDRLSSLYRFLHEAKQVPDADRVAAVVDLVERSAVDVPTEPFGAFQPMTWDRARTLEAGGLVTFGPHSVTHPILSRVSDAAAEREIVGSWRRVQDELDSPLRVFCYPNGEDDDFGSREVAIVRGAGLDGAVRVGGLPVVAADLDDEHRRYSLPRTPFPASVSTAVRQANGIDHLRGRLRRR